ncbi:caspase family protein [Sulfurimonas sp.]|jgi:hypothetical protein|uniref:caspase family protein n=1 Tax=Sulfurimonas sp. TaxID=2022749 RepID=UPI0025E1FA5A|nr:caspase family protein [Sulfurimonas sp.]
MLNINVIGTLFVLLVFSGCSVKNIDASFSYKPQKKISEDVNNRIAFISKFEVDDTYLDDSGVSALKLSLEETLKSSGMYSAVQYNYKKSNKNTGVDEYQFVIKPSYTRDFNWLISWPGVYPMPAYWPLQQYHSDISSSVEMIALIGGKKMTKTFTANKEVDVRFYGFFRTSIVEKSLQQVIRKNLKDFKSYLEGEARFAILETANNPIYYADNKSNKSTSIGKANDIKGIINQYAFKETKAKNFDSFALVIGINEYKQNTPVEYADLSAMAFKSLAEKTLGIPKENIITLLNDDATSGQIKAKIELVKELSDAKGNIYVYFAGHGVPGKDGNTYMLPNDMSADSIHLEPNLQLDKIYAKLSKSNAKNVFVFMDSCFSGKDDKGGLLYKGVAPVLRTNKTIIRGNKLTVITAGSSTDFANDYKEKKQRLFTYYLIKELAAGKKNLQKVYSTIKGKVKRTSLMKGIGYKQVPQIFGNSRTNLF